ncbi:hypothetical protein [Geomesophilobacter sediminis]|uniref:Uncharacterized protein n=1 Tax=Geomesophilobacter sediminis TaxID=2798584 RepID=A0A8J7M3D3_9BACT|nr:hypothetical protein [Geomesophilobacter sediminis]MBJ6727473.1 hypothetical protein [Geomesophilobacter sediminis]
MSNHLFIYLIVALNAACHAILIWRLKLERGSKWRFCLATVGVPAAVALAVRLGVATGILHAHLAEQVGIERIFTSLASMLLIGGPWGVTAAAVLSRKKEPVLAAQQ